VQLRIVIQQVEGTLKGTTTGGWSNQKKKRKAKEEEGGNKIPLDPD
jgi:hypothetical protein